MKREEKERTRAVIRELLSHGLTQVEVANRLGISKSAASNWARKLGFQQPRYFAITPAMKADILRRFASGESGNKIAEYYDLPLKTILRHTRKAGLYREKKKVNSEEDRRIYAEDYRSGLTVQEIAEKHGVSRCVVDSSCYYFDVQPRGRSAELTKEVFERAEDEQRSIARFDKESAQRYRNLIIQRARQMKEELGVHSPKYVLIWAHKEWKEEDGRTALSGRDCAEMLYLEDDGVQIHSGKQD